MDNKSVRYSRAGDVFHYRWAARRCLRMVPPNSPLKCVVIEGSKEDEVAGEYVIDVAEYIDREGHGTEEISYFQLKHSTTRPDTPFVLSDLKGTIKGFAKRFFEISHNPPSTPPLKSITFSIITNRQVKFKQDIQAIANGRSTPRGFRNTLEKYTSLTGEQIQAFCSSIKIVDGEGDYKTQQEELQAEISQLLAGAVDNTLVDSIIALVQNNALPDKTGQIFREDILKRFGVTNERDLFPAPPEFEEIKYSIQREQHDNLLNEIVTASAPIIIHAAGGVGKSVVARQLADSLPKDSLGIVYDCFGSGKYRNRSQTRHRHRDALVQIINEIASLGLCEPLIPLQADLDDAILRAFLSRLQMASAALREINNDAVLVVFVDAADNAEMAAEQFRESCFAHELLREHLPEGCRIVLLCRTERVELLRPPSVVRQLELLPFSQAETLIHLHEYFPQASHDDGIEFCRLTAGNPRVQANALSLKCENTSDVLMSLGPSGMTVNEQINNQLAAAVSNLKEDFPDTFQPQIDAICLGLANLSPFIPIKVLAVASAVDADAVKSFVADLGRPLWLSDDSVQFRDEPTETWFRETFSASELQIESYVDRLKPLAAEFSYVAEVLPSLLLQSGKYDELISLALSDDFLPEDSPIDQRNVRVYRLQFAFKAALKQKRYADAAKLALRAGEEVAGDNRQLELLKTNVDLIAPLQSPERVQELAFRRLLRGNWDGSENVYSASLLSSVEDFKGEARGYLRAAEKWLRLYFEEHKRSKDNWHNEHLQDEEIVELVSAHFNLFGPEMVVNFILSWRPPEVIFRITRLFIRRLVDAGHFEEIDIISCAGACNQYLMIAVADELLSVGRFPPKDALGQCLDLLCHKRARIPKSELYSHEDTVTSAIVSFIEACAGSGLSTAKILRVRRYYVPRRASHVVTSDYQDGGRNIFLRAVALESVLSCNLSPNLESLMPEKLLEKGESYEQQKDIKEFKQIVAGLLPWYIVRARLLGGDEDVASAIQEAGRSSRSSLSERWRDYDPIPFEISRVRFEILIFNKEAGESEVDKLFQGVVDKDSKIKLKDRLYAARAAYRLKHLSGIRSQLEQSCSEMVETISDEGPETKAGWFIDLARAVLPVSLVEAAAYFDCAIEAVSKFGDEIVERWEAVVSVAKRSAEEVRSAPEMAYRFIRTAELVGDTVAREKYFNRNEAVRVCHQLCSASSFAAISRWRDRDVGWFDSQLPALAHEVVASGAISPSAGWALSAFFVDGSLREFAALCLEKESDATRQQYILDTAVRYMRLQDTSESDWLKLGEDAQRFSLANRELENVLAFYAKQPKETSASPAKLTDQFSNEKKSSDIDWEEILGSFDLTTSVGISNAIERFRSMPSPWHSEIFWQEVYKRIPETDASKFLQTVIHAESAGRYDIQNALEKFPESWRKKISVRRIWNNVLSSIAQRFARELINYYGLQYFLESIRAEDSVLPSIQKGIMEGLANSCDLIGAGAFFGFAGIVSSFISPQEATDLLDFALSRFEEHIDDDHADGPWADWLTPPEEISDAFAGFVWSALGSPRSSIRWQAAHCVRRLADADGHHVINYLIKWMNRDCVGAFGSNRFPFYNLHARQYLLIGLARVSIDNPEILRPHHAFFVHHALENMPHVLIQKYEIG
ncbi:MAG TPA: ATP-binding protein, partial [Desulfobulbaceae bacterium]|nr:ATP-binding protein [Desulfobulbaceae bacterium]